MKKEATPQKKSEIAEKTDPTPENAPVTVDDKTVKVAPDVHIHEVQSEEPLASEVADKLDVQPKEAPVTGSENRKDLHTISAGDLERHPELKDEHKLKEGDQIAFGSVWVWKYATADRSQVIQEQWPRDVAAGKL